MQAVRRTTHPLLYKTRRYFIEILGTRFDFMGYELFRIMSSPYWAPYLLFCMAMFPLSSRNLKDIAVEVLAVKLLAIIHSDRTL